MMKKMLFLMSLLWSFTPAFAEELSCQDLHTRIIESQQKINSIKIEGTSITLGEHLEQMRRLEFRKNFIINITNKQKGYTGKHEDFIYHVFGEQPFSNASNKKGMGEVASECQVETNIPECSKALYLLNPASVTTIDQLMEKERQSIATINSMDETRTLLLLSQNYSQEFLDKKCEEENAGQTNIVGHPDLDCKECRQTQVDRFAIGVLDVVTKMGDEDPDAYGVSGKTKREDLCKDLTGTEYNLAACVPKDNQCAQYGKFYAIVNGKCEECKGNTKHIYQSACYTCPKNHEVVYGTCMVKCSNVQIRDTKAPYACLYDEAAQKEKNQRKQRSLEGWGKVARVGAITAIAVGGVVGTAYLLKEIFKGYFTPNDSSVPNQYNSLFSLNYTGKTKNYYEYNTTNTTGGNNYYSYPSYNSGDAGINPGAYNGYGGYGYGSNYGGYYGMGTGAYNSGYSPYYMNQSYYSQGNYNPAMLYGGGMPGYGYYGF